MWALRPLTPSGGGEINGCAERQTACPRSASSRDTKTKPKPSMLDSGPLSFPASISIRSKEEGSVFWDKPQAEMAWSTARTSQDCLQSRWERGWRGVPNTGLLTLGPFMSSGTRRAESNPGWGGVAKVSFKCPNVLGKALGITHSSSYLIKDKNSSLLSQIFG